MSAKPSHIEIQSRKGSNAEPIQLTLPVIGGHVNQVSTSRAGVQPSMLGETSSPSVRSMFSGKRFSEGQKHQFGIEHFEQQRAYNDIQGKQQQLENRIRRLAFEQDRAQKLTDIATTKAEKLLQARERHQSKVEQKMKQKDLRMKQEEEQRLKNLEARQQSINRRDAHLQMQINFKNNARQQVQLTERMGYKRRVQDREEDQQSKRLNAEMVQYNQHQFMNYKNQSKAENEAKLAEQYAVKETARQRALQGIEDKLRQLENVESYMVNELGLTQKNQQRALTNLHNVVQLCNQQITLPTQATNEQSGKSLGRESPNRSQLSGPQSGEQIMITQQYQ